MTDPGEPPRVSVVIFDRFELLDVFGPLEMFGALPGLCQIEILGPKSGEIQSAQGPRVIADRSYDDASAPDIVLVPGGIGTRQLVEDTDFVAWLHRWSSSARYLTSVCTGSGVLAAAGLLDGYRATSNKRAFDWARLQGPRVEWVREARWVTDRNRWTSSGVAAGMDMALALIGTLFDADLAQKLADAVEYDWHQDPHWDPFAAKNGLVPGQSFAPSSL
jgi:transcriptional regulator GlxA family with amidase domain